MATVKSNLVLNDRVIAGMTMIPVKGIVAGYVQSFARETKQESIVITNATTGKTTRGFPRTGRMARAWTVTPAAYAPTYTVFRVTNKRPYAVYVLKGTKAHGSKGGRMPVGKTQVAGLRMGRMGKARFAAARATGKMPLRLRVRGQKANNIPMKAVAAVMVRRGL
jgi:hypothetical protein